MIKVTEQPSRYTNISEMSVEEITSIINEEDKLVPQAINAALPQINSLIGKIVSKLSDGGRLFYIGAGSGGRLSVLDAIELPTTYGIPKNMVTAILAGGIDHLIDALEEKEDDEEQGWLMLQAHEVSEKDIVVGISASGSTPFVLSALKKCSKHHIITGCIVSNQDSPIALEADFPIEVITGPELITGSTRMKCGTMQKMIFDIISTTTMIQLGRVNGNKMVNVKLINAKIIDRAVKMLMEMGKLDNYEEAKAILMKQGSVKIALEYLNNNGKIILAFLMIFYQ